MSIKKHREYIDTASAGLIKVIEHNLDGIPLVVVTDYDTGQEVYVSLYDPRLTEVKVLDSNNVQFTFASSFKGFLYFYQIDIDNPSTGNRLTTLEEKYVEILQSMDQLTNKDQWAQMNTLLLSQVSTLESKIVVLQNQVNLLSDTVDGL